MTRAVVPPSRWALPDPRDAEPGNDVVAVGADLEPSTVFAAYQRGLFPMHLVDRQGGQGELAWWSPDPRGILPLDAVQVSRSLVKSARRFRVTVDTAFDDVMLGCADRGRERGWITAEFRATYGELHRLGWAHSIEVWDRDGLLAGGLYGIEIGGLFAGESMFHRKRDASKVALVSLVERLRSCPGERVMDVQWRTDHLASLGAIEVPRPQYLRMLDRALPTPPCF
ncbi:MAG: leucyl/phenylalanyl-tRNA--protein transferase [Actinomycetota bacterium]|nr:leucyl/phenylalanyl-tRNA--protein transferase [Actinomycetota bacterium]